MKNKSIPTVLLQNDNRMAYNQGSIIEVRKLIEGGNILIYHGNKDKDMIPTFGVGDTNNDYGSGFYTTHQVDMAREWAWSKYTKGKTGYVHCYTLNLKGLSILNFTELSSLHWLADLYTYRTFNIDMAYIGIKKKFIRRYKINTDYYDVIIGYRADDSYFKYASDFLTGGLMKKDLDQALILGGLGLQICIKSKRAFSLLVKQGIEEVNSGYRKRFTNREILAKEEYTKIKSKYRRIDYLDKSQLIHNYI